MDTVDGSDGNELLLSFEEFEAWYESVRHWRLEPAMKQFERLLNETLDGGLDLFNRRRIRIAARRIKGSERLWKKIKQKYSDKIFECDDILEIVDDLIGLRIVCNNVSDISRVQELLGQLPTNEEGEPPAPLAIEAESERRYFQEPKASGYRAYHINLVTPVAGAGSIDTYRAELQVRTLLQDGWGELTHEDTYKPGAELPPLAETLARRMADLLATVDDIAEDIRRELDRQVQAAVDDDEPAGAIGDPGTETGQGDVGPWRTPAGGETPIGEHPLASQASAVPMESLLSTTREVVAQLTRTTPLAAIAHELQQIYGSDIAQGWGGVGSFKALLRMAVPDVNILEQGPGYVVPEFSAEFATSDSSPNGGEVPEIARTIRLTIRGAPSANGAEMKSLMDALMYCLEQRVWDELDIRGNSSSVGLRELNLLSRSARDRDEAEGRHVTRKDLDFLLKALLWSGNLHPGLSRPEVQDLLSRWFGSLLTQKGLRVEYPETLEAIVRWLEGEI